MLAKEMWLRILRLAIVIGLFSFTKAVALNSGEYGMGVTATPMSNQTYEIGKTSFSKEVWLKNGALFSNVGLVEIEMSSVGAFELQAVDNAGKILSRGLRDNPHGGWSTFDFSAGIVPPVLGGTYKLKLVNASAGVRQVKQGRVSFR